MTNLFLPNLVAYGDATGLGVYEVGHFLQHQQYLQILAGQGVTVPDWDILHMRGEDPNEFLTWLNVHEAVHEGLRANAGVSGIDLSQLDPRSADQWELWQEAHRQEHALFDVHFGTT